MRATEHTGDGVRKTQLAVHAMICCECSKNVFASFPKF